MLKSLLFKQYLIPHIGAIMVVSMNAAFYITVLNFLMLMVTTWATALSPWAVDHLPWLKFWMFLVILLVLIMIALVLHRKFVMPSVFAWSNRQSYTFDSPIARDLEKIKKALGIE